MSNDDGFITDDRNNTLPTSAPTITPLSLQYANLMIIRSTNNKNNQKDQMKNEQQQQEESNLDYNDESNEYRTSHVISESCTSSSSSDSSSLTLCDFRCSISDFGPAIPIDLSNRIGPFNIRLISTEDLCSATSNVYNLLGFNATFPPIYPFIVIILPRLVDSISSQNSKSCSFNKMVGKIEDAGASAAIVINPQLYPTWVRMQPPEKFFRTITIPNCLISNRDGEYVVKTILKANSESGLVNWNFMANQQLFFATLHRESSAINVIYPSNRTNVFFTPSSIIPIEYQLSCPFVYSEACFLDSVDIYLRKGDISSFYDDSILIAKGIPVDFNQAAVTSNDDRVLSVSYFWKVPDIGIESDNLYVIRVQSSKRTSHFSESTFYFSIKSAHSSLAVSQGTAKVEGKDDGIAYSGQIITLSWNITFDCLEPMADLNDPYSCKNDLLKDYSNPIDSKNKKLDFDVHIYSFDIYKDGTSGYSFVEKKKLGSVSMPMILNNGIINKNQMMLTWSQGINISPHITYSSTMKHLIKLFSVNSPIAVQDMTDNYLVIKKCRIQITFGSPSDPRMNLKRGNTYKITWKYVGALTNVDIAVVYGRKSSPISYIRIATKISAGKPQDGRGTGSYDWLIPDDFQIGPWFFIRIYESDYRADDGESPECSADSKLYFSISSERLGKLKLTNPVRSNLQYTRGDKIEIAWKVFYPGSSEEMDESLTPALRNQQISIVLSKYVPVVINDDGFYLPPDTKTNPNPSFDDYLIESKLLVGGYPLAERKFVWVIPDDQDLSWNYIIEVIAPVSGMFDRSQNFFEITKQNVGITILSIGTDKKNWQVGGSYTVKWKTVGPIDYVQLSLLCDTPSVEYDIGSGLIKSGIANTNGERFGEFTFTLDMRNARFKPSFDCSLIAKSATLTNSVVAPDNTDYTYMVKDVVKDLVIARQWITAVFTFSDTSSFLWSSSNAQQVREGFMDLFIKELAYVLQQPETFCYLLLWSEHPVVRFSVSGVEAAKDLLKKLQFIATADKEYFVKSESYQYHVLDHLEVPGTIYLDVTQVPGLMYSGEGIKVDVNIFSFLNDDPKSHTNSTKQSSTGMDAPVTIRTGDFLALVSVTVILATILMILICWVVYERKNRNTQSVTETKHVSDEDLPQATMASNNDHGSELLSNNSPSTIVNDSLINSDEEQHQRAYVTRPPLRYREFRESDESTHMNDRGSPNSHHSSLARMGQSASSLNSLLPKENSFAAKVVSPPHNHANDDSTIVSLGSYNDSVIHVNAFPDIQEEKSSALDVT